MATQAPPPNSAFLAPRYWPTWLGIGLLCLIAWLPFRLRMAAGALLGKATWLLAKERRYITDINIRTCFPELDRREQDALVYQSFIENGIGLIETATGWIRPPHHFRNMVENRGRTNFARALAQGRGVLLLGAHYSTLDFCANLLSLDFPLAATYRAHKNPLFDAFMLRGRLRNCSGVFDRKDIRGAFRHLREGNMLWYAPDQDYGPEKAVYAPFFGQPAATITAGSRFAAFNDSPVLIVSHRRLTREKKYILEGIEAPAGFPTGDDTQDAVLINQMLEREIRKAPAQYLWMHKRFKTRPGGKAESPYIFISTPNRRLNPARYAELLQAAQPDPENPGRMVMPEGMQLWFFAGLAEGLRRKRHPALQLDQLSKRLRAVAVSSVIVDSLFRVPHLRQTVAAVLLPVGDRMPAAGNCSSTAATDFLLRLHGGGLHFRDSPRPEMLAWTGRTLALLDPLALAGRPGSSACVDRATDLRQLANVLKFSPKEREDFFRQYLAGCRASDRNLLDSMLQEFNHPLT